MQNRVGQEGSILVQERNLRDKLASSVVLLIQVYDRFCELRSKLLSGPPSVPSAGMVSNSEPPVEDYVNFIQDGLNLLDSVLTELNSRV